MKLNLILILLFALPLFISCEKEQVASDLPTEEIPTSVEKNVQTVDDSRHKEAIVDFTINNEANTLSEKEYLLVENNSVNAVSYQWDFGNGDTSTDANPNYRYDMHGYFDVVLTITDAEGNIKQMSDEILVLCVFTNDNHAE